MGCCQQLSRGILIAMNLPMMALGILIVGGSIWIRFDEKIEHNIRSAFMDTSPNPSEMYEFKQQVRTLVSNGYWGVIGFGVALTLIGFIGLTGAILLNKTLNGFYLSFLILLIILEAAAVVFFLFMLKNNVQEKVYHYISMAFQYNLQDSLIIRDRLACCGDGYQNNYQCQQLMLPNCRDMFTDKWNTWLGLGVILVAGVFGMQLLATVFSIVMACSNKYTTLNETPSN